MPDVDLAVILGDGEYLKREAGVLVGAVPEAGGTGGITTEDALDAVMTAMTGTAPIVVTKNDAANTIVISTATFSTSTSAAGVVPGAGGAGATAFLNGSGAWTVPPGGGAGISTEDAVDAVAAALVAGTNVDISYNDTANTITVDVEALTSSDIAGLSGLATATTLAAVNTAITDADVPAALNGLTGVWIGTAAQYTAVTPKVATVVYLVTA